MMMLETEAPSLAPALSFQIAVGHTMVLDAALLQRSSCLNVAQGLMRVAISGLELEPLDAPAITACPRKGRTISMIGPWPF